MLFWDSVRHCVKSVFQKSLRARLKERRSGPQLEETLIDPLFTDVAFRRNSEGDGSGHYESGGVMSPPSPVLSAPLGGRKEDREGECVREDRDGT